MEDEPVDAYNSDSGADDFDINNLSDDQRADKDMDDGTGNVSWIQWFCSLEGHEFIVEIDEEYIRDPFNLYGLQ